MKEINILDRNLTDSRTLPPQNPLFPESNPMWQTTYSQTSVQFEAPVGSEPPFIYDLVFCLLVSTKCVCFTFNTLEAQEQIPSVGKLSAGAIWFHTCAGLLRLLLRALVSPTLPSQGASFCPASSLPVDSLRCWQPLPISVSYICYLTLFRLFSRPGSPRLLSRDDASSLVLFLGFRPTHDFRSHQSASVPPKASQFRPFFQFPA